MGSWHANLMIVAIHVSTVAALALAVTPTSSIHDAERVLSSKVQDHPVVEAKAV